MHPRVHVTFADSFSPVRGLIDRRLRTAEANTIIPYDEVFQKELCTCGEKNTVAGASNDYVEPRNWGINWLENVLP